MSSSKGLVLDANILIRAVLGKRVRSLLEKYEDSVEFYAPDLCFEQAREYLPAILEGRGVDAHSGLAVLNEIRLLVQPVDRELYQEHEQVAQERMSARDIEDWPVVAVAILLGIPIWTEDQDFFGSGVATWTTDRVELYLVGKTATRTFPVRSAGALWGQNSTMPHRLRCEGEGNTVSSRAGVRISHGAETDRFLFSADRKRSGSLPRASHAPYPRGLYVRVQPTAGPVLYCPLGNSLENMIERSRSGSKLNSRWERVPRPPTRGLKDGACFVVPQTRSVAILYIRRTAPEMS